ncbi:MAG: 50S ribosomal protein L29 [Candidatus Cloacimonetes bacterium]|jgi:large subunit ribosomal protein L29|nr:50S ribosomal protein L29 [Candidatus Cloacimonadota bacterium]MBT6993559.1 50S ribosomal protein L29 [Candidatus Cloacimonadota bacterium]MBT7470297.1 50S ribosomal protein L29 [Candidatus Cloacimonadota bacterium]
MKVAEMRELSIDELNAKLNDFVEELFNLRFQQSTSRLENADNIVKIRKNIARVKTLITEKEKSIR